MRVSSSPSLLTETLFIGLSSLDSMILNTSVRVSYVFLNIVFFLLCSKVSMSFSPFQEFLRDFSRSMNEIPGLSSS